MTRRTILLTLLALPAFAQLDERRITSPNGQIEFRLFVAPPPDSASLDGIAYQVWVRGKMFLDTSYLGFAVYSQEPFLGEKVGLVTSKLASDEHAHSIFAEYLQNGSLGRRINVEARAFDDGVAFRYVIPRSAPLDDLLLTGEVTEFRFASNARPHITATPSDSLIDPPFVDEVPGIGWISISEIPSGDFPHMSLLRSGGGKLQTILPLREQVPPLSYRGRTPVATPWRIITIGATREDVDNQNIVTKLH